MGDLQSQAFIRHIDEQIKEAEAELELVDCFGEDTPEAALAAKKLARANNVDKAWNRFVGESEPKIQRFFTYGSHREFPEKNLPREIPGASISPANLIEQPKVVSHDLRPWPQRTFQMTLGQAKQERRQKHVCRAINNGYFPHLIREKAAQSEFERALEEALRARD
jgi:hypothetical protein